MKKIWKQRYQILEEAGSGGNGTVYRVWDLHLEKEWAMKLLEGTKAKECMGESQVLKQLSHPNFPRIVDAFEEEGREILIMDYIRGISLEEVIAGGTIREEDMAELLLQICDAVLYLHQRQPILLYLDLKPSNIIIEENKTVKLVDLGSVLQKGHKGNVSGSFGFASPEQVRVQKEGRCLTEQSDVFSFGMVAYAMATGSSTRLPILEEKSRHGVFIRKENPFLSLPLERLIEKCTRGNFRRRYSGMREVRKALEEWQRYLEKKGSRLFCFRLWKGRRKSLWYQEKSFFCTQGRHSIYIAKKLWLLLLCICCLLPVKSIRAREEKSLFLGSVRQREQKGTEQEELKVQIRDRSMRNVLVRKGCIYEMDSGLFLEIPEEEIGSSVCMITVECQKENGEKRSFCLRVCGREAEGEK